MAKDLSPQETHMMDQIHKFMSTKLDELVSISGELLQEIESEPGYDQDQTRSWAGIAAVLENNFGQDVVAGMLAEAVMRIIKHSG